MTWRVLWCWLLLVIFPLSLLGQESDDEKPLVPPFWILQFRHSQPKHFSFSLADYKVRRGFVGPKIRRVPNAPEHTPRESYWYMIYTLTTTYPKPIRVFIDITAESTTHEAERLPLKEEEKGWYPPRPKRVVRYHDSYYPLVQQAIELQYRRRFWGQADLTLSTREDRDGGGLLNAPVLGGVNRKKEAILNFTDGLKLRGKITAINRDMIQLTEYPKAWNFTRFLRSAIRLKDRIRRTVVRRSSGEMECTLSDIVGNELVIRRFGQSDSIPLDDIEEVSVVISRKHVPSISYECIAIFRGWDRHMDYLRIYVKGLTNGVFYNVGINEPPHWSRSGILLNRQQASLEADELERHAQNLEAQGYKERAKYLQRIVEMYRNLDNPNAWVMRYSVLILSYERPGDEFYPTLDKLIFKKREWKTYVKVVKMDLPRRE